MMKRMLLVVLGMLSLSTLVACGDKGDDSGGEMAAGQ
jgi:hypothetical protein